jgi:hypothetical protein
MDVDFVEQIESFSAVKHTKIFNEQMREKVDQTLGQAINVNK